MSDIHTALVAVQGEIRAAHKSGENKFDHYAYAKLEDFMDQAKAVLAKHKLALVISTEEVLSLDIRTTKGGGTEHAARVKIRGQLIHASGDSMGVMGFGEGQDRGDKAIYKAITGAKKYLIAGLLAIPTTDDPEADETVGLSTATGKVAKVASATGVVKDKKPDWSKEQVDEAGALRALLIRLGGDPADEEVKALKSRMKYDDPQTVIDEMGKLRDKWIDIAEAAREEAAK